MIDGGHAVNLTYGSNCSLVGDVYSDGGRYSVFVDPIHHSKLIINDMVNVIL